MFDALYRGDNRGKRKDKLVLVLEGVVGRYVVFLEEVYLVDSSPTNFFCGLAPSGDVVDCKDINQALINSRFLVSVKGKTWKTISASLDALI